MKKIVITTDSQNIIDWSKRIQQSRDDIQFTYELDSNFEVGYYIFNEQKIDLGKRDFDDPFQFQRRISKIISTCNN